MKFNAPTDEHSVGAVRISGELILLQQSWQGVPNTRSAEHSC
jgi:hypothetical protein